MQQLLITRTLQLIGGIALWCWVPITVAKAQIAPDGTLTTNVNTSDGLNFTIDNGNRAGNNLFHSFREFSVPTGGSAFFNNALDVQNIFSRVTGGNISNIDGSIKANGVANLFLINPSGIIFGPNARLNIGGSFLASTANSLIFDGGIEFSANNSSAPPLLAINIPVGIQFRDKAAGISVQRSTLEVQPDKTLALVGGGVLLSGANLNAPGGQVELGGLAGIGAVGLNVNSNLLQLNFPDGIARSAISITNKSSIDVRARNGGNITINAQILNIFGESSLQAGSCSCSESVGVQNGDITLNVTGAVSIRQSSSVRNDLGSKAAGESGNIIITAGSLSLADKALITNSTFGQGNSGSITINVRDNVSLTGDNTSIFGSAALGSVGDAGNINIEANSLSLSNGARLATDTFGKGNAGNVSINVRDRFSMAGDGTTIFSTVASGAIGNGGEITIKAKSISLTDGAFLIGRTFGQGNAGSISVQAEDSVSLENSFVLSNVEAEAIGKGGNISIQSGSLSLSDGAELVTTTLGQGDAGSVTIKASGIVSFDGVSKSELTTGVFSTVEAGAKGKGGDIRIQSGELSLTNGATLSTTTYGQGNSGSIEIQAQQLLLSNGSQMLAATSGQGDAGNILVQADDSISLIGSSTAISSSVNPGSIGNGGNINIKTGSLSLSDGSGIFNSLETDAVGNAGNINITTISFSVINGSQVIASTRGRGDAGDVTIQATDTVFLDGVGSNGFTSGISSSVENGGEGKGGDINITTGSLSVTNRAQLATGSRGQGSAGSINITARDSISFSGESAALSRLEEFGSVGKGGDINITTGSLFVTDGSNLATSTRGQGDAGNITITARDAALFDGVSSNRSTSGAFSTVEAGAVGNGGDITIIAGSLSLTDGAELQTLVNESFGTLPGGRGNAGNVRIEARDTVTIAGASNGIVSGIVSGVSFETGGNGGEISVTAKSLLLADGAEINTSTFGEGNAGSIFVQTQDSVSLTNSNIFSKVEMGSEGKGGDINIKTGSLSVTNGSELSASTLGKGNAGNIKINASDAVFFNRGFASGFVSDGAEGKAGNVDIKARSISVINSSQLAVGTAGRGDSGNLIIEAVESVSFDGISGALATVESGAVGKGGNITLTARSLSVTNGAALTASTRGTGNAGNVTIQVDDSIFLDGTGGDQLTNPSGASSVVNSGAIGNGGNVTVTTGSLSMTNGAVLLATTFGNGNAGNVKVKANNEVYLDGSFINSAVIYGAVGNGGNITIAAKSVSLLNGAGIGASTFGNGNSGSVFLQAEDSISLSGESTGIRSTVDSGVIGNGGNIEIKTGSLSLSDGALLNTSTFGQGNAGSVFVQAEGSVSLSSSNTNIFSTVEAGAVGKGGDINITAGSLSLINGSQLQTLVRETSGTIPGGRGNAGNLRIEVRDALTLSGKIDGIESAIISDLGIGSVGNSGDVTLIAKSVFLSDGARISTSNFGQGNAGSILVQAQDSVSLNNGNLFTTLEFGAVGRGGDISITANNLVLTEGSNVSSSTLGQGDSGNIILENRRLVLRDGAAIAAATASEGKGGTLSVTASDSIELIGATADGQSSSGLTTQSEADGAAGNLIISTGRLILQDRAEIAVAAKGKGAAGNLEVTADSIRLNNGTMTGETAAGDRGNITLQSQDVQLRHTSSITTNAQGIATGGNITIDTGILAALENSDIRANAQQGFGGQVRINAQGIFGSVSRTREDLQTLLNTNDPNLLDPSLLPTSDITAISQQGGPQSQGSVQLITPDVDPSSGLIELPQTIVDPDALIAQNPCTLGKGSEFTVTGRGGLPPNPSEALSSRTVRVSLVEPTQASTTSSNTAMSVRSPRPDSLPIVPAQGWILNEKGQLVFTAYDPTGTGTNRLGRNPPTCPAR